MHLISSSSYVMISFWLLGSHSKWQGVGFRAKVPTCSSYQYWLNKQSYVQEGRKKVWLMIFDSHVLNLYLKKGNNSFCKWSSSRLYLLISKPIRILSMLSLVDYKIRRLYLIIFNQTYDKILMTDKYKGCLDYMFYLFFCIEKEETYNI